MAHRLEDNDLLPSVRIKQFSWPWKKLSLLQEDLKEVLLPLQLGILWILDPLELEEVKAACSEKSNFNTLEWQSDCV